MGDSLISLLAGFSLIEPNSLGAYLLIYVSYYLDRLLFIYILYTYLYTLYIS